MTKIPEVGSSGEILSRLAAGETRARDVVRVALDASTACQAEFNAFARIDFSGAELAAAESERRYADRAARTLEGLPVAIKDLIDTKGLITSYGSKAYCEHVPQEDASVIRALRATGAIVVGKTTTHEFAWGVTTASIRLGNTLNPRDPARIPGGSSGGTAAAVASGAVTCGLGTDTGGSVRIPAALCGVVGFKPSFGRISTDGVFPLAPSLDHVGFLGRNVDDVGRLAGIFGIGRSEATLAGGLRIGTLVQLGAVPASSEVREAFELTCAALAGSNEIVTVDAGDLFDNAFDIFASTVLAEGGMTHFSRRDLAEIDGLYEPETVGRLRLAEAISLGDYARSQSARRSLTRRVEELLGSLDVLLLPTCPCVAPLVGQDTVLVDEWSGSVRLALMNNTAPFNLSGMPAISIPARRNDRNLPVGIQLVARTGDDERLLEIARAVESLTARLPAQGSRNPASA